MKLKKREKIIFLMTIFFAYTKKNSYFQVQLNFLIKKSFLFSLNINVLIHIVQKRIRHIAIKCSRERNQQVNFISNQIVANNSKIHRGKKIF